MITLITLTAIAFVITFIASAIATANSDVSFALPVKAYAIRRNARNVFASLNTSMAPVYATQRNEQAQAELSGRCAKVWANLNASMVKAEPVQVNGGLLARLNAAMAQVDSHIQSTTPADLRVEFTEFFAEEAPAYKKYPYNMSCKTRKSAREHAEKQTALGYNVVVTGSGKSWNVRDAIVVETAERTDAVIHCTYFPQLIGSALSTAVFNWSMSNLKEYDSIRNSIFTELSTRFMTQKLAA